MVTLTVYLVLGTHKLTFKIKKNKKVWAEVMSSLIIIYYNDVNYISIIYIF